MIPVLHAITEHPEDLEGRSLTAYLSHELLEYSQ